MAKNKEDSLAEDNFIAKNAAQNKDAALGEDAAPQEDVDLEKSSPAQENPKKKMSKGKRIALVLGSIILLIAAAVGIAYAVWITDIAKKTSLNTVYDEVEIQDLKNVLTGTTSNNDPYYVLLLGSDSRDVNNPDAGRSDSLILARIDPAIPSVSLLSIPRDTKIQLEGYGTQKINAAFAYGKAAGAVEAVSKLCGVQIADYVEIDFDGMVSLVDQLGGVTVNVPVYIYYNGESLQAGEQTLNGQQALLMSRSRNFVDGDFQRMKNQRILLQAIAKKILASSPTDIPGRVTSLASCVVMNMSPEEAIGIVLKLQGMDAKTNFSMVTIPVSQSSENGIYYLSPDPKKFSETMEKFKSGKALE